MAQNSLKLDFFKKCIYTLAAMWVKTEQMLEILKGEPDVEQQYCHYLGGILRSTHWLEYSSKRNLYGDSTNWFDYTWYSESEFVEMHAGEWWMREI